MSCDAFWLTTSDGLRLYGRRWLPTMTTKAMVCLVHGFSEHTESYIEVGEAFSAAGYGLICCDWRGHGRSEGRRGYTPSYEKQSMADLSLMLDTARTTMPDVPLFFYGHSMGGGMVLNHVLRHHSDITGVICTSPLLVLAKEPTQLQQQILRHLIQPLWPSLSRSNYSAEREPKSLADCVLTRDLKTELNIRRDPLRNRKLTYSLAIRAIDAGQWALQHAHRIDKPLLLTIGTGDKIVSVEACRQFAAAVRPELSTFKLWEGAYHELHRDIEKEALFAYLISWLDGQMARLTQEDREEEKE